MTSETPPPLRRFVTAAEVAGVLRLDESDVEGMLESGELRGIRVGPSDAWRIEKTELDSFIEGKYEEARRHALWNGHDYGSIVDIDPPAKDARG